MTRRPFDFRLQRIEHAVGDSIYHPMAFTAIGDGVRDDSGDLSLLANSTIPSDGGIIIIDRTYRISSSITFPSNVDLKFVRGGKLKLDSGVTVTINGNIEAHPHQIFEGDGNISFGKFGPVFVEWWGAVADDSTDCTTAFNKALSASDWVQLQRGRYKITGPIVIATTSAAKVKRISGVATGRVDNDSLHASVIVNYGDDDAILSRALGSVVIEHVSIVDGIYSTRTSGNGVNCEHDTDGNIAIIMDDVYIYGHMNGVRLVRPILTSLKRVTSNDAKNDGFLVDATSGGGGTSTLFLNCWARSPDQNGYEIIGLTYSSFISCASDGAGANGYYFHRGTYSKIPGGITLVGCGAESCATAVRIDGVRGLEIVGGNYVSNTTGVVIVGSRGVVLSAPWIQYCTQYGIDLSGQTVRDVLLLEPCFNNNTTDIYDPNNYLTKIDDGVLTLAGTLDVLNGPIDVGSDASVPEYLSGWVDSANQTVTLGTLPANAYVTNVRIHVTEAFDSDGTDEISVGYDTSTQAFATLTDVSTTGIKSVTLGSEAGYNASSRTVKAYYVNGGSEPTVGKAMVILEYVRV